MSDKERRAEWLDKKLTSLGVPSYGRASQISKEIQCANPVVTGWLRGSLPSSMDLCFKFCDRYGINPKAWWRCEEVEEDFISSKHLAEVLKLARQFEKTYAGELNDDQYFWVVKTINESGVENAVTSNTIAEVLSLFPDNKRKNGGNNG